MRGLLLLTAVGVALAAPVALAHEVDQHSSADLSLTRLDRQGAGWLTDAIDRLAQFAPAGETQRAFQAGPTPGKLDLVGHNPLAHRGMNAAHAVYGGYAYIGSRTDGTHAMSGVQIVDVRDPTKPAVVGELGLPSQGRPGESSRELRIIPHLGLLMVLNHGCSELIHRCANPALGGRNVVESNVRFFDITGENAAAPKLVSTYFPSDNRPQTPHEIFVWSDPLRAGRVLLYMTTPSTPSSGNHQLVVTDISRAREGEFKEFVKWRPVLEQGGDRRLHSLTVSNDGRRAYLAYLGGGFLVADTSQVAEAREKPELSLVTPPANSVHWGNPGAHSAIKLWDRDWVLTTDEVYGKLGGVLADHGCPWGWVRMIDIADATKPRVATEYKLPINDESKCAETPADRENLSSFSAHNPTLTEHLALITWHSAGFQMISTANPSAPAGVAEYIPEPLPVVQTEDPALSSGRDKVVMWSFPVVVDGLIYLVDLRNGLYILRYSGPFAEEIARLKFLDGNSNSGDALRLEPASRGGSVGSAPVTRPGGPPGPIRTIPPACLPTPVRASSRALGPFRIGMSPAQVRLRGGRAERRLRGRSVYCVRTGGYVGVTFAHNKAVVLASNARAVRGGPRPGSRAARRTLRRYRRAGSGIYTSRGRFVVVRRGRVRVAGTAARHLRGRALRSAIARTGIR